MARAGIHRPQLRRTISRQAELKVKKRIVAKIQKDVARAKTLMLAEFESHPVTKEIRGGPDAHNISGTLGGIGNLFSFIGFHDSDRPIAPVASILESSTRLNSVKKVGNDGLAFIVTIDLPSKEEITQASPIPWATARSWVIGIEQGLSGFGQFLVKPGKGRSTGGLQVEGVIRSGGFKNRKYISAILQHLNSNLIKFLKS